MNYETARKVLIEQTHPHPEHPDALLTRMQQGKPPIPGQITSILLALKVVFEALKDTNTIDKELAHTLYQLTVKTQHLFASGMRAGINWPPLLKEDLIRIGNCCESIFAGKSESK